MTLPYLGPTGTWWEQARFRTSTYPQSVSCRFCTHCNIQNNPPQCEFLDGIVDLHQICDFFQVTVVPATY